MITTGLWHPVYDQRLSWVGVKLGTDAEKSVSPDFFARMAADLQAAEAIGDKLFFVGAEVLAAGHNLSPLPFPPSRLVVVHNEIVPDGAVLEPDTACVYLLDAITVRDTPDLAGLRNAGSSGAKLFAHDIDSMALFEWCAAQGFSYFTFGRLGYPENGGASQDTSRLPLMRLLSLVAKDAQTAEMEAVFKLEPKLAFDLLRLVNSTSFGLRTEIISFTQAILVLGRRQLQRWLQLLLFAHRSDGENRPNILMQRAAERGRMMELLAQAGHEKADQEMAFMVGVFSVLDVLMATPLAELLKSITLPQAVEQALLHREGRLGALLDLVCAAEESDFAEVRRGLPGLGLNSGALGKAQLEAIFWALRIAGTQ